MIINDYGVFLGKKSQRLTIKQHGKVISEYPLFDVDHIIIDSKGVTLSSDLIQECANQGIPIDFLGFDERPYASLHSPNMVGTVRTRREQLLAYYDKRSVELTKVITCGKLQNQANNLRYFAKYRKKVDPSLADDVEAEVRKILSYKNHIRRLAGQCIDDIRQSVLTLEAHEGKCTGIW